MGLRLHLTFLLPNSLEGPPSYKPPTPKAKLEEPEMVSTSPGAQAAPTSTPAPFPTEARARRVDFWGEASCERVLTCPSFFLAALPAFHSWGLRAQPTQDPLL